MTDHKESLYVWKILDMTFGTIFGTGKLFSKKYTYAGGVGNQHLPLALSVFL